MTIQQFDNIKHSLKRCIVDWKFLKILQMLMLCERDQSDHGAEFATSLFDLHWKLINLVHRSCNSVTCIMFANQLPIKIQHNTYSDIKKISSLEVKGYFSEAETPTCIFTRNIFHCSSSKLYTQKIMRMQFAFFWKPIVFSNYVTYRKL